MPSFTYGLGKGLKEPCSPNREAYFFGAELNSVNADGWNCLPNLIDATSTFGLSAITFNHEVVVALVNVTNTPEGNCQISWKWYRNRDNAKIFEYSWSAYTSAGNWLYAYSFIGWTDWEINENGAYRVEVTITGAISYTKIIQFTVTGISEPELPPELPLDWLLDIRQYVSTAALWFKWVRDEVNSWVYPFSLLSSPFDNFYRTFWWIASLLTDAHTWAGTIAQMVGQGISWTTIWSNLTSIIPNLTAIRDWFYNWWVWVDQRVTDWWAETKTGVISWINAAKDWAWLWIEYLEGRVNGLQTAWDSFVITTLPTLPNWLDIDDLIKSWFVSFSPLWEGWQDWRDKVAEFFSDPEQWFYDRLDSFFERYW